MILIFLGSFRSTVAIFLSIPLSILAGAFGLQMSGSTINIMTLGGFALAIGRLVDDSTVVLENINRHLAEGKPPATRRATAPTKSRWRCSPRPSRPSSCSRR